ncbi:putative methyltransferase [Mycolicibacterium chitae]|uniref:Putative methyltransferase n=1 Tax=Mycolicibacterium chitae TaxID=1792 RepID=A0A448IDP7_MYCCI|nr:class I SAM-dependent methyltransferase [Mycolicibacterium chitae]MCV7106042.1 class I SAM-dependent methyltransferase [Mycolicibacterium chitae]BBZ01771.1 putative methyltransferase [Mycolicibacterium chitae]VEG50603.1 putative methyltransferase [Mycolicibacterium chitae]
MSEVSEECRACGAAGPHQVITVREMYYGTRELFEYFVCSECDTLQILNVLDGEELARHYPRKYYSYDSPAEAGLLPWLTKQQDRFALRRGSRLVGGMIAALPPGIRSLIGSRDASGDVVRMLGRLEIPLDARILDVGCGNGTLLERLAKVGFTNLAGADPFIETDVATSSGVPIAKQFMNEVTGEFDLIMFNHSLEHVPDPVATLRAACVRLVPGGICLVRLPTTSSEAWKVYGRHWCLIDAPRHTLVPSRRGMELAAGAVGMRVQEVWDDSNSSQFFGSEAYRRDIALPEIANFRELIRLFGMKQMWRWERQSDRLNREGRGDQTAFVLRAQ